jgi:predicted Zn-dependent protease
VDAFALPGGFSINKGLLLAADNEAELAGVKLTKLRVAARHAVENRNASLIEYAARRPYSWVVFRNDLSEYGRNRIAQDIRNSRSAEEEEKLGVQYVRRRLRSRCNGYTFEKLE